MIDHVSVGVADLDRARRFYDMVLATLGYRRVMDVPDACGYGGDTCHPVFWIGLAPAAATAPVTARGSHIAFVAPDRAAVEAFYRAALAEGAVDNGPPGLRPHYHSNYYAAFVIDPDGHKLEAVCHKPV